MLTCTTLCPDRGTEKKEVKKDAKKEKNKEEAF